MTVEELRTQLVLHDDGVLSHGTHHLGDRAFCALEFDSMMRGRAFSDDPITLPDLRPLNDGPWPSASARTDALLPVMVALWDWSLWTPTRRQRWIEHVVIGTVREIVAELPTLPTSVAALCRDAATILDARVAAGAAKVAAEAAPGAATAREGARAANAAATVQEVMGAATWAAWVAGAAAARTTTPLTILSAACAIWIRAAEQTAYW